MLWKSDLVILYQKSSNASTQIMSLFIIIYYVFNCLTISIISINTSFSSKKPLAADAQHGVALFSRGGSTYWSWELRSSVEKMPGSYPKHLHNHLRPTHTPNQKPIKVTLSSPFFVRRGTWSSCVLGLPNSSPTTQWFSMLASFGALRGL